MRMHPVACAIVLSFVADALILSSALLTSPAFAQLEAISKKASAIVDSVTTTQTVDTSQLRTVDGDPIGEAVKTERPAITVTTRAEKAAAVVFLQTERPIGDLLIRIKSKTCKPTLIEPGVYSITEAGRHELDVMAIGQNPLSWDDASLVVEVGTGPSPDPNPVPIPPTPGVAPIEGPGLRVLFVSESGEQMPRDVEASFYSPEIAAFLNANCIKVDGNPDFRRVDPDTQFTDPNHRFAKALARPRASLPWLIISNGASGYEGPFPKTVAETLTLIRSFVVVAATLKPSLTLYVSPGVCPACNTWKALERDRILGVNYSESIDTSGQFSRWPAFVLEKGGKRVVLTGYQSAETIVATLDGIK